MDNRVEIEKDILRRMQPIVDRVAQHTVPLFSPSPNGHKPPRSLGSGILIRRNGVHFVLTAGHCLRQNGELTGAGIFYGREFAVLSGPILLEQKDPLRGDIGMVMLDLLTVDRLKQSHSFLDETSLLYPDDHLTAPGYLVAGFPNAKVSIDRKTKGYQADLLFHFCDRVPADLYTTLGFDLRTHVLLAYDEKKSSVVGSGQLSRTVHPVGMSGGGFWHIPPSLTGDITKDEYFLVGVLIEYYAPHKTIVGTQMNVVDRMLANLPQA